MKSIIRKRDGLTLEEYNNTLFWVYKNGVKIYNYCFTENIYLKNKYNNKNKYFIIPLNFEKNKDVDKNDI